MASRRLEREFALKITFAHFFNKQGLPEILQHLEETNESSDAAKGELCKMLSEAVFANGESYDKLIEEKLTNWTIDRIPTIDRMIMRLAVAELFVCSDIPKEITINETIELTKKYGTDKSRKFVNGVIDAVYKDLKEKGEIDK